jgi:hypothetical protein
VNGEEEEEEVEGRFSLGVDCYFEWDKVCA